MICLVATHLLQRETMTTTANTVDLAIVGGGIVGLWAARRAANLGARVAVVEQGQIGGGASGTVLGALLPHLPGPMSPKRAFQFAGLRSLKAEMACLAHESGCDPGYRQDGRIMPIRREGFATKIAASLACVDEVWRTSDTGFRLEVRAADAAPNWLSPCQAPLGLVFDTLSARVETGALFAAFRAALTDRIQLIEGTRVVGYDLDRQRLALSNASGELVAERVLLTAGYEVFSLAAQLLSEPAVDGLGHGVKGQAALLELAAQLPEGTPVLYDNGCYLVPHGGVRCAVGATTQPQWNGASDAAEAGEAEGFLSRAHALSPALKNARVIRHWAGVRPRTATREPMVGPLDALGRVWLAGGGYKITLGIAHLLAQAAVDEMLLGQSDVDVPEVFRPPSRA